MYKSYYWDSPEEFLAPDAQRLLYYEICDKKARKKILQGHHSNAKSDRERKAINKQLRVNKQKIVQLTTSLKRLQARALLED